MAEYAPGTPRVIGQYVCPVCECGHRITVKTTWTPGIQERGLLLAPIM